MTTIFALSSGALPSAIAVFRISGSRSLPILREITRKKIWEPARMQYTKIFTKEKEVLDTAMAVYLPGPSTFTGEDTAELFVHGSRAVADALSKRLMSFEEVRQATRGEFTKRAFFNGKMDFHEVRGLRNLINAETERQRQMSFSQMRGGSEARRTRYITFREILVPILKEVILLERRAKGAEIVHRGLRAVIFGRPNTGKSSLMNALTQRDVAIVSEQAGTTRDSIEVRLNIAGVPMSLTDTAGIRETADALEKKGIDRAKQNYQARMCILVGVQPLMNSLERFVGNLCPNDIGPYMTDTQLLRFARGELECALSVRDSALLCDHIQRALDIFGEMTGSTVNEQILDDLFKQFCIGK
ncbi:unnamed protein product [Angiostrongylus costaricensis]|uniref:TrmE-type G domain-containing protein n=1 Tax=Angiostrongylus costaricensis TaxID=334426 RepID=A0A158PJN1_ANGCS|nr:unnamed protein product [Angiostrongylus costaricensis]